MCSDNRGPEDGAYVAKHVAHLVITGKRMYVL
jgi:hypothetical protein